MSYSNNKQTFPGSDAPEWHKVAEITPEQPPTLDYTKGTDRSNATIEVEKDEVILTPDLKIFKVKGETHANGGVPYFAEGGEFVYSNQITMVGKAIKDYFTNKKFSMMPEELQNKLRSNLKPNDELDLSGLNISDTKEYSMADIAKNFLTNTDLNNLTKEMSQSLMIEKTSSKLNLQDKLKELSILSNLQETVKDVHQIANRASEGGYYMYQAGNDWFGMGGEYSEGGEYEVSEDEANNLRNQGYDFDIL